MALFQNTSQGGAINFAPPMRFGAGQLPSDVFTTDVNGDGKPDLVVPSSNEDVVYILINISAAGKIAFAPGIRIDAGFSPSSVFLADLDGDGLPEMVVTNRGNDNFSVYPNTSTGGVVSFGTRISYQLNNIPYNVSIGDLDGDGKPDLAITTSNSNTISIVKNRSTRGNFSFDTYVAFPGRYGYDHRYVNIADMNGDGKPDLVVTEFANATNTAIFTNMIPGDGLADIPIRSAGATSVCAGESTLLSTDSAVGALYQWYKDGTVIPGATDTGYTAKISGSYYVTRSLSGVPASSGTIDVVAKTAPPTPVISVIDTVLCQGISTTLTSSIATGNQWFKDGSALPASTGQTYLTATNGVYTVTTQINGCISAPADNRVIVLATTPTASVTGAGPSLFCLGDSAVLQANKDNTLAYQWYLGDNPVPGAITATYTAKHSGNYTVAESNGACTASASPIAVTATPTPDKPIITQSGQTLRSSAAAGNQWYKDGQPLTGDTTRTLTPTAAGGYTVTTTLNGCVSPVSDALTYTPTATNPPPTGPSTPGNPNGTDSTTTIRMGPNPVKNELWINFKLPQITAVNVFIYDLKGNAGKNWRAVQSGTVLNLAAVPNGFYYVRIFDDNGQYNRVFKLLKE